MNAKGLLTGAALAALAVSAIGALAQEAAPAAPKERECYEAPDLTIKLQARAQLHVVKGDIAAKVIGFARAQEVDVPPDADYVVVVIIPDMPTAWVLFGHGEQLCTPVQIPTHVAWQIIGRPA